MRAGAAARLAADVASRGNHLTTGFLGTPYLCHMLSSHGQLDTAYTLLNQDNYPSWLYPVKKGATTIWERWDDIKPDGSFQSPAMNSFNHYAYGSIGEWMYRVVAGIDLDPEQPGFKHAIIAPQPGGGLTWVSAHLVTPYGLLRSRWEARGDHLDVTVRIPGNSRATVRLPAARLDEVRENGTTLARAAGISSSRQDGPEVVLELAAGEYRFTYPSPELVAKLRRGPTFSLADPLHAVLANPATRKVLRVRAPALLTASESYLVWRLSALADARPELIPPSARDPLEAALRQVSK